MAGPYRARSFTAARDVVHATFERLRPEMPPIEEHRALGVVSGEPARPSSRGSGNSRGPEIDRERQRPEDRASAAPE
jgi:hypothetical protein